MHEEKGERAGQFVRELFFDLQTIDGVKPLEIWNGFREPEDQGEKAALVKNLYKIALPLVNEHCAGKPFEAHAAKVYMTVAGILKEFSRHSGTALFESFPDPPTSSDEQKELYRVIKESAAGIVEQLDPPEGIAADRSPAWMPRSSLTGCSTFASCGLSTTSCLSSSSRTRSTASFTASPWCTAG